MTSTIAAVYSEELQKQVLLLASSGLGACFSILYKISRKVARGTHAEKENFQAAVSLILGLISGVILAQLLPVGDVGDLGTLTKPTLALIGGFSFALVFRILTRLVESIEALFAPDAEQQAELTQQRFDAAAQDVRTGVASDLVRLRSLTTDPAVLHRVDELVTELTRATGSHSP